MLLKNQRGEDFSEIEKIKLCLCLDTSTDSRWSTLVVKSKILPIVPKVFAGETVFDWIFGVYEDNFHNSGLDYGYPRIA